jgi:methyl-accepting chemotaxis protein
MQRILIITRQTSDGTKQTASVVGNLSSMADELKLSMAKFQL